jgi:class 3 adenylate cyclase/tetratricopeptide (TPR) repeat protein
MKCIKCGTELNDNASFCPKCGNSAERHAGEIKDVSVLFTYLDGLDDFREELPPDEVEELTGFFMSAMDASVKRFGGTVNERSDDGFTAFFGTPVRREKDTEMAVRAGLDMVEFFDPNKGKSESRTVNRVGIRVGIATGSVHFDGVNPDDGYETGAEVADFAREIKEDGEAGLCFVDESTYRLTERLFRFETWPGAPVGEIWVARELRELPAVLRNAELVNRNDERSAIVGTLETLRSGNRVTICIVGPAGAGKSALMSSVLNEIGADNHNTFVCEGDIYAQKVPFVAWTGVVSNLFNRTEFERDEKSFEGLKTDDDWWPFVADVFGAAAAQSGACVKIDPETKRDITMRLVAERIYKRAAEEPVFLVVENAQWLDGSSLDLLRYVIKNSVGKPVATVAASRDEDPIGCAEVFEIKPLGDDDARELLLRDAEILSGKNDFVDKAVGLARGNVYYLREIAKFAERAGRAFNDARIPSSVRGMIQEYFDNLGGVTSFLIKTASVLGQSFEIELLRIVTGLEKNEFEEGLGCLYAYGILERYNDRLRFVNILDQEIALGMVEKTDQVAINEAAAEALASFDEPVTAERANRIARHYINAAKRDEAVDYLREAGLAAYGAFDVNAAKYFIEQARSICIEGDLTDKQIDVTLELAGVIRNKADIERILLMLREDFSLIVDNEVKGDYLATQGNLLARLERMEEAETHLAGAISCFEKTGADGKKAKALVSTARIKALTGRYEEALSIVEECRNAFEELDDILGKAEVHNISAFVCCIREKYDEAAVEYKTAYDLWKKAGYLDGVAITLNNLAGINSAQGDFLTAVVNLKELLGFARLSGDKYTEAVSLMNLSYAYYKTGNLKAAEDYFVEARKLIDGAVFDDIKNTTLSYGVVIRTAQGRYDEARGLIEEFRASEIAETREQLTELLKIYEMEVKSKTGVLTGEEFMALARRTASRLDKQGLEDLKSDFYTVITEAYIRSGMLDEAERAFGSLTEFVSVDGREGTDAAYYASLEVKLLLAAGEYGAAGKKAVAALKNAKENDDYRYVAENLSSLTRTLYAVGDERWRSYAVRAVELFEQLGAEPLAGELREEFDL